jgi:hypothetical protein
VRWNYVVGCLYKRVECAFARGGKRQQQDTSKPAKGKRGREPTIVIVFFHRTTIDGESSQKLNKIGKTFSSRCGVYLAISRKDKRIKQKTKAGESEEKDKTFSAMWKKTKVFSKSSPLLNYTLLLVLRCLAGSTLPELEHVVHLDSLAFTLCRIMTN